jgi:hypothetical protein
MGVAAFADARNSKPKIAIAGHDISPHAVHTLSDLHRLSYFASRTCSFRQVTVP